MRRGLRLTAREATARALEAGISPLEISERTGYQSRTVEKWETRVERAQKRGLLNALLDWWRGLSRGRRSEGPAGAPLGSICSRCGAGLPGHRAGSHWSWCCSSSKGSPTGRPRKRSGPGSTSSTHSASRSTIRGSTSRCCRSSGTGWWRLMPGGECWTASWPRPGARAC